MLFVATFTTPIHMTIWIWTEVDLYKYRLVNLFLQVDQGDDRARMKRAIEAALAQLDAGSPECDELLVLSSTDVIKKIQSY